MPTPDSISRETDLSGMEYKWGFTTDVDTELAPKGLDESIVRLISQKKETYKPILMKFLEDLSSSKIPSKDSFANNLFFYIFIYNIIYLI